MYKDIEEAVISKIMSDVKLELEQLDIAKVVENLLKEDRVNDMIKEIINKHLITVIERKTYANVLEAQPYVDKWTSEKVDGLLREIGIKK